MKRRTWLELTVFLPTGLFGCQDSSMEGPRVAPEAMKSPASPDVPSQPSVRLGGKSVRSATEASPSSKALRHD
jgi:hypothetical protein